MSEPPDFEQIADQIVGRIDVRAKGGGNDTPEIAWVAEQLRQVWNARGAADLAALSGRYVPSNVAAVIKQQDR